MCNWRGVRVLSLRNMDNHKRRMKEIQQRAAAKVQATSKEAAQFVKNKKKISALETYSKCCTLAAAVTYTHRLPYVEK